jgi:uncharacterized membrane protein YhfC
LIPFVERFFVVRLHTGLGMILAYGLVRGIAPATFVLAALLHAVANYSAVLLRAGLLDAVAVEAYIGFVSLATVGFAAWLRHRALQVDASYS